MKITFLNPVSLCCYMINTCQKTSNLNEIPVFSVFVKPVKTEHLMTHPVLRGVHVTKIHPITWVYSSWQNKTVGKTFVLISETIFWRSNLFIPTSSASWSNGGGGGVLRKQWSAQLPCLCAPVVCQVGGVWPPFDSYESRQIRWNFSRKSGVYVTMTTWFIKTQTSQGRLISGPIRCKGFDLNLSCNCVPL